MKKLERIAQRIEADKKLFKAINNADYYNIDRFIKDAEAYIKAVKEGRMVVSIGSVSASGMSRTIKFTSCEKNARTGQPKNHYFRNYNMLFDLLGYEKSRKNDFYFRIHGGGMDMIFHTNYVNMHNFKKLGFISKKQCEELAQQTPSVI